MEELISNNVKTDFKDLLLKFDYKNINEFLSDLEKNNMIYYPNKLNIFRCFNYFNVKELKYVILGQDPYQGGIANGLAFSIDNSVLKIPPSLRNITKEYNRSLNKKDILRDLSFIAEKNVLLLNTALTVDDKKAGSHINLWKSFTEFIIKEIDSENVSFFLWGNASFSYNKYITKSKIYKCGHPSPLNRKRDFEGNNHFKIIFN